MSEEKKDEVQDEHDAAYYKQQAEQEQGNARRAKEAADAVTGEKAAVAKQLEEVTQQLQDTKDAQESKEKFAAVDKDLTDPGVVQNLQQLQSQLEAQQESLNEQSRKISQYEDTERKKVAKAVKDESIEKICTKLDEDFGPKFRTEARKLADGWVDKGSEKQPADWFDAFLLMEKAYKKVSEKSKKTPDKKEEPTDKGVGGDASFDSDNVGTGSRNQVLQKLRKSWKGSKTANLT